MNQFDLTMNPSDFEINLSDFEINPSNIKITRLFPTPLPSIKIPQSHQLNQALSKIILAKAQQIPSVKHSNIGGGSPLMISHYGKNQKPKVYFSSSLNL